MPTALVTGIAGQDGSYLAELLLGEGYRVTGVVRRNSVPENQTTRLDRILDRIELCYGNVTDYVSLCVALERFMPDLVFNLAAQSHVRVSFDVPWQTTQTNAVGAMNVFNAARKIVPEARIYQASSSEMFGACVDGDGHQRETTPMHPTSPYGCAKLFAYSMARHCRRAYGQHIANGILFNHESPRRASNFVTAKICKTAVEIKLGLKSELVLGNLDAQRDWGFARDYAHAMLLIAEHDEPDDFVIATGETRSVRDFCEIAFGKLGMDYREYVKTADRYKRPEELPRLCGDASKARRVLGWRPTATFDDLVGMMIEHWKKELSRGAHRV